MEFDEAVSARRSIRKFKPDKAEKEQILKLLESARLCQSSNNRQPWMFYVSQGVEKDKICKSLINKTEESGLPRSCEASKIIEQASHLILIFKKKDDKNLKADFLSIGACMEHICLKAVDLGLGAVCIGDLRIIADELAGSFSVPDTEFVIGIAVGYPDEEPKARKRKALNEVLLNKAF